MFWKSGTDPWSLSTRLTVWFALTALAMVAGIVAPVVIMVTLQLNEEYARDLPGVLSKFHISRDYTLSHLQDPDDLPVRVINPQGVVVHDIPRTVGLFSAAEFPAPGGPPRDISTPEGKRFVLASQRVEGWIYQAALDRTDEVAFIHRIYQTIAITVAVILVLGLSASHCVASLGLRPLRRMAESISRIEPNQLDRRVDSAGLPKELRVVTESFNRLLDRLQDSFTRLDQFSGEVAHELRTPVHNLRGAIEVALTQKRTPEDHERVMGSVLEESDRLVRLIDRLLLLARVSNPRHELRREVTHLADELAAMRDFFEPSASELGVSIRLDDANGLVFPLDRALFQRAISNLLANALAHTPTGGEVVMSAKREGSRLCVAVVDTGEGIAADLLPRLFDRFYRSPSARASGRGVGLGLALVKRVVELHGGVIEIESQVGVGTTVRTTFPETIDEHDTDVISVPRR